MATCRGRRKRPARRHEPVVTECDKAFGGGGGENDGGTASRMQGSILTWLAEHKTPVFVLATANGLKGLPPEMTRRFGRSKFIETKNADFDIVEKIAREVGLLSN